MQELLRYYERELAQNEVLREEFARRYPALASHLGVNAAGAEQDPHIRRLLQGVALMNAHTAMRIDRNYDRFTEALLNVNYPHYLRPFPSCTIVQFDAARRAGRAKAENVTSVPRGSMLHGPVMDGVRYQFQTVFPVEIAPVSLAAARFGPVPRDLAGLGIPPGVTHCIGLTFENQSSRTGIASVLPDHLNLFLDADAALSSCLRDTLSMSVSSIWTECDGNAIAIRESILDTPGFADEEALLPYPSRSHQAYRLLLEFGCFPEKFNFLRLDMRAVKRSVSPSAEQFSIYFAVRLSRHDAAIGDMLAQLTPDHLRLGCTPAVNLFPKAACPVSLDHTKAEYSLPSDSVNPRCFDIYSVDSVTAIEGNGDDSRLMEYHPYYSLRHGESGPSGRYWLMRRDPHLAHISPGHEHFISFVDLEFDPLSAHEASVSIGLTCTNGHLPTQMRFGAPDGDFSMANTTGGVPIRMLRKPTPPYRLPSSDQWRLVSHLSLNNSSLMGHDTAPLSELLTLYNLPRSAAMQKQIDGIAAMTSRQARIPWQDRHYSGFLHGVEISLSMNEEAYAGTGLHAFTQLLDHFFGLYVHLNSFVQLVVVSAQTGKEILRCAPRSGSQTSL
ncbi:type VI secretion system baseplate subunit TssF [Massilia arenosa]|uniref:Type VI secretion system baseplate subunit TssF n=1 Tax=Zemynaea arenosa TaxID=2561931 RepID=A0A4Y9RRJ3_9BURK|nr:type VI secretion system baseplate subunit TssF [Massilia arenosa]TFW11532.1 type VI secretion system baseplate subunit TssF [Massilia arenosa]